MKQVAYIILLISFSSFSQSEEDSIYQYVDQEALFPGGTQEMMRFLYKNIEYPSCVPEDSNTKVYVQFVVEKDGMISNIIISKESECVSCDRAVIKAVSQMPKWNPASRNGKIIRSYVVIPIRFGLN